MAGKKNLIQNILSLGAVQIANYVFPLITVPIISRIIGPEKYGVLNFSASFILYFMLLIGYGFSLTSTRRIIKDPSDRFLRCTVFSEVLKTQVFLLLVSVILFIGCLFIVPALAAEKKVAIFSFLLCFSTVLTQDWLFQAMQELPKIAILQFIGKLLFTLSILLVVHQPKDYVWQPLVIAGSQIVISIISFIWSVRRFRLKYLPVSNRRMFELLSQERVVFFSFAVISIYTTTNVIVLGLLRNPTEVGYYTAAQNLVNVVSGVVNGPIAQSLFPFIGVAFAQSLQDGIQAVKKILPILFYLTLMVAVGLIIVGPFILTKFYGDKFAPSISVFQILSFVPLIISMSNIFGIQVMLNLKMDKPFFKITAIGALIGIVLNCTMTHFWGNIGTAMNWVVVECYITCTMYFYLRSQNIELIEWRMFSPLMIFTQIKGLWSQIKNR